jgi:hypothetical protein
MSRIPGWARRSWRLSPLGWAMAVALVVLVVLGIVDPSAPVFIALAALLLFWGLLLTSRFPAGNATLNSTWGTDDLGKQAEEDYRRQRELD